MAKTDDYLTLAETAEEIGCHYQTIYRHVRSGALVAQVAGGTYRVRREDLEAWMHERDARSGAVPSRGAHDWPNLQSSFLAALLIGDAKAARVQTERLLDGGVTIAVLCDLLFGPTLQQIGQLWIDGALAIADEHRASRIVEGLLERSGARAAKSGPRLGCAVVAAPQGDRHALAAQMVAIALQTDGFRINYLGADLPADEIVAMAVREQADIVALSCCVSGRDGLSATLAGLVAGGFPTLVGGPGISESDALALGATCYGASIVEAQTLARALVRNAREN